MSDVMIKLTRYNKLWMALLAAAAVAATTALSTSPESFGLTQVLQIAIAVVGAAGVYAKDNWGNQSAGKFVVALLAVLASFLVAVGDGLSRPEVYAVVTQLLGAVLVYATGNRPAEDIDHTHVEELANAVVVTAPVQIIKDDNSEPVFVPVTAQQVTGNIGEATTSDIDPVQTHDETGDIESTTDIDQATISDEPEYKLTRFDLDIFDDKELTK